MVRRYRAQRWTCESCELIAERWAWDDAPIPSCSNCGREMVGEVPRGKGPLVVGDECDVMMPHAICHEDGTPRRYRSKSEMRRVAAAKGYMNAVEHKTLPGTDKSPFTTSWDSGPPPGYDPRPMAYLTPEEQIARKAEVGSR